ncbi:MAG: lyase family protein, partial [Syntrophobacteraceae bacterium]
MSISSDHKNCRAEHDLLGERTIPEDAYWGVHTLRALENFRFTSHRVPPPLILGIAQVKKACCLANMELGYLDRRLGAAISAACDDVLSGGLDGQFPLDALQGGAGTSTNMNVNEVLANRALELLGHRR